jgi:tetraacyldisaccharide 4'-kinase
LITINHFEPIIISIGNIKLGGTGKTPIVEYLIRILNDRPIAILSRGYKRRTKEFLLVNSTHSANEVGDENRQLKHKFKNITIACDTNRPHGVQQILEHKPHTEIIILDDAYQHRKLHRDLDIVLTEYNDLYTDDQLLPIGNLRESKKEIKRAHIIIITKCPENISRQVQEEIINKLNIPSNQKIYFSYISSYNFIEGKNHTNTTINQKQRHILITGIANHRPLLNFIKEENIHINHMKFKDHHHFTNNDIRNIIDIKKTGQYSNILLMTEKDFYRFSNTQIEDLENHFTLIYIQIKINFIHSDKDNFNNQLLNFKKSKN